MRLFDRFSAGVLQNPLSAVSAGVGGVGSLIGGLLGSGAAKTAATSEANAAQQGITGVYNTEANANQNVNAGLSNADTTLQGNLGNANSVLSGAAGAYQPYQASGQSATAQLPGLISGPNSQLNQQFSFDPSNLASNPGYQFTLQQGQQAIDRSAAAQGGLFSSGTLKSLANYTTGAANQYFNTAYNQASNTFNTNRQGALSQIGALQGLSGQGLSATQGASNLAGQQSSNIQNTASQIGGNQLGSQEYLSNYNLQGQNQINNLLTGKGQATAAGQIGAANAWSGALGGLGNAASSFGIMNYLSNGGYGGYGGGYGGGAVNSQQSNGNAIGSSAGTGSSAYDDIGGGF